MAKVVGKMYINGKEREIRESNGTYFYTEDTGNSSRKVDLTPTQVNMLKKDFINYNPPSLKEIVAERNGLTLPTNSSTNSSTKSSTKSSTTSTGLTSPIKNGVLVGSYDTGSSSTPAWTDGSGNYFYSTGNSTVKIKDLNKITVNDSYKNTQDYINNFLSNTSSTSNTSNYDVSFGDYGDFIRGVNAPTPQLMTAEELAKKFNFNYDYDYILNMLNEGTDMYLNEMTEKAKQLQGENLRNQSALYQQYLDTLRASRANAVNTGINRGALAAQELGQYLLTQQQIGSNQSDINDKIYELYNAALTEKAKNKETAREQYNALGQALMSASANFNANDVQRYAADIGAASQIAASINQAIASNYASDRSYAASKYNTDINDQLRLLGNSLYRDYYNKYASNILSQTNLNNAQAKKIENE